MHTHMKYKEGDSDYRQRIYGILDHEATNSIYGVFVPPQIEFGGSYLSIGYVFEKNMYEKSTAATKITFTSQNKKPSIFYNNILTYANLIQSQLSNNKVYICIPLQVRLQSPASLIIHNHAKTLHVWLFEKYKNWLLEAQGSNRANWNLDNNFLPIFRSLIYALKSLYKSKFLIHNGFDLNNILVIDESVCFVEIEDFRQMDEKDFKTDVEGYYLCLFEVLAQILFYPETICSPKVSKAPSPNLRSIRSRIPLREDEVNQCAGMSSYVNDLYYLLANPSKEPMFEFTNPICLDLKGQISLIKKINDVFFVSNTKPNEFNRDHLLIKIDNDVLKGRYPDIQGWKQKLQTFYDSKRDQSVELALLVVKHRDVAVKNSPDKPSQYTFQSQYTDDRQFSDIIKAYLNSVKHIGLAGLVPHNEEKRFELMHKAIRLLVPMYKILIDELLLEYANPTPGRRKYEEFLESVGTI